MGFATAAVPVKLGCEAVVADWNHCTQNKSGGREEKLLPSRHPSESVQTSSLLLGWPKSFFRNQNELFGQPSIC